MRVRLLLRQATSSLGASIAIALIVAVAAGLFTAWPRLARATFVDEVTFRTEQTSEYARALTGSQSGWPVSAGDDGATYAEAMTQLDDDIAAAGPALQPQLGDPELMITMAGPTAELTGTGMPFDGPTPRPSDLRGRLLELRAIDSLLDHVTIVEGRAPEAWPGLVPDETDTFLVAPSTQVEVMFSAATAEAIGVEVGDELTGWGSSVPVSQTSEEEVTALVTGLFEARDPDETYWQMQTSGLTPRIASDPNVGDFGIGAAYVHQDTAAAMSWTAVMPTTQVWIPVDAGVAIGDVPALLDDLQDFTARDVIVGGEWDNTQVSIHLETALIEVLEDAVIAQRGTAAVLTLLAAGPVGVTFALLALTARLSVTRRRDTLALASARGGSPLQIRGSLGLEGLVLGLPAAAVGAAVSTLVVPGSVEASEYLLPLLAGLAPAVFLAGESLPNLRTERHDLTGRSTSRWRWVVETLVVALAAGAVYLLLSRGLQATTTTTVDPLATATPLLVALATAVLATRLFPFPMRVVHALSRRRRDLAAFLGSARAIREGGAGLVPMLALLVATSIAIFSTTMLTTLSSGVGESTRAETGADMRLVGPPYPDDVVSEIVALEEVAGAARVYSQPSTRITEDTTTRQITLYAVDTATLPSVQADVVGAAPLPDGMDTLVDGRLPIVVSEALGAGSGDLNIQMRDVIDVQIVGTATEAAGLADRALWAIVDLDLLREVSGQNLVPRMVLVDLEPDADPAASAAAVSDIVGGIGSIDTADSEESGFLASPSARSMQQGFVITLVLSVLQSVLALVLTLVLAAPARGRLVAVLRTLGIGGRDARRLVSWEVVPLAAVALVAGTVLGLALPHLVVATVDLSPFTGQASPSVVYDWPRLGLVLAAVIVVIGVTLVVASTIARRLSLSVLRIGDAT